MTSFRNLIGILLVGLIGCQPSAQADNTANRAIDTSKEATVIEFRQGNLRINGHEMNFPESVTDIVKKIGRYERFTEKANDIYTYDNSGFILWSERRKKTIYQLGVYIKKEKPIQPDSFSPSGTRFVDSRPKQDFSGTFILDGVRVTRKMTFDDLNAKKDKPKFNRTHWAHKYKYYAKVPGTGQHYQVIAYLLPNRKIEYIEISYMDPVGKISYPQQP